MMKSGCMLLFGVVVAMVLQSAAATVFVVGDTSGWINPTANSDLYDNWEDNKVFRVGDILIFNFTTGEQDVAEVTEDAHDACTKTNPIGTVITAGPANITLTTAGEHYYICTIGQHCENGQKLDITVQAALPGTTLAPPPPPTTTSPSPANAPTPAATVHVVGDTSGWIVPTDNPNLYDNWEDNKVFRVGDILTFNFTTGEQDVAEVTEAAHDACTKTNPIGTIITAGPANITLTSVGEHYYISTIGQHCENGQKLDITVQAALPGTTMAPPPPPTTTSPSPANAPTPAATVFVVGDTSGWINPTANPDLYDNWEDNKVFRVGDILTFNFTTGEQDVAEVTEAAHDACTKTNPIGTIITAGPANITLTTVGEHYYISTIGQHCENGQKLDITVQAALPGTTLAPPPPPTTTSPSPTNAPTPAATVFVVGDTSGWINPTANPDLYDNWEDNKVFRVGDILTFNFTTGEQDVAEVTEAAHDACTKTNPIGTVITSGPANITLTTVGEHYYISTIGQHCENGQKLDITVQAALPGTTLAPPPPPTTTSPSPANAPTPAPGTTLAPPPPTTTSPPPSTTTSPSPANAPVSGPTTATSPGSSSSVVLGSAFVTLSSIVMGLFF